MTSGLDAQLETERQRLARDRDAAKIEFDRKHVAYEQARQEYERSEAAIAEHLSLIERLMKLRGHTSLPTEPGAQPAPVTNPEDGKQFDIGELPVDSFADLVETEGATVRQLIGAYLRERDEPVRMFEVVHGLKNAQVAAREDTIRGVLQQMRKSGEVTRVDAGVYALRAVAERVDSGTEATQA